MPAQTVFSGFPRETAKFYRNLARNNNRAWFLEHKDDYHRFVLEPAVEFVEAMGEKLKRLAPDVVADPRTNGAGSIFRIYRDTRFSKDKEPYKTHLGIHFSVGAKKMDSPGFYFHLEPNLLLTAVGHYRMGKESLAAYREAVVHEKQGPALRRAVRSVLGKPGYKLGGLHYKKVPRGYDPEHKSAVFLLHQGLYAYCEEKPAAAGEGPQQIDHVLMRFKEMAPIYRWLRRAMP